MNLKKLITVGLVTTTLFSTAPIGLISPVVLANKVDNDKTYSITSTDEAFIFGDFASMTFKTPNNINLDGTSSILIDSNWNDPQLSHVARVVMEVTNGSMIFESVDGLAARYYTISNAGKKITMIIDNQPELLNVLVKGQALGKVDMSVTIDYANETLNDDMTGQKVLSTTVIDGVALQAAKDEAIKEIDGLPNLTTEEKQGFKDAVNKSETTDKVAQVVQEAKDKDAQALQTAKDEANKEIDALPNLTAEEKQGFKDAVNGSKTTDEVAQALQNAKNKDKENADAQALQTAKDEANKEIDALPNLTAEEKQGFKDAVNGSKTTDEVAQALQNAKNKDKENADAQALQTAKDEANKEIDALPNLTAEEKQGFKDAVNSSKTTDEVAQALQNAKDKDAQVLQTAKDGANKEIDGLPNLTAEEKQGFKDAVNGSKTTDEVAQALQNAKDKDANNKKEKELEAIKEKEKEAIDQLPGLTDEEKNKIKDDINNAKTEEKIKDIVDKANETSQLREEEKALQDAKDKAKEAIDQLPGLTDEEKNKIKDDIDNAKTQEKIKDIVDKANETSQLREEEKALQDAKNKAKAAIDALQNLTNTEKQNFKDLVDSAKSQDRVSQIVSDAVILDNNNLSAAKKEGIATIEGLKELTLEEKNSFITKVNDSKLVSEIKNIVDEAIALNKANYVLPGDLNADGHVKLSDLSYLLAYLKDETIPSIIVDKKKFLKAADFNGDGKISLIDYAKLQNYLMS